MNNNIHSNIQITGLIRAVLSLAVLISGCGDTREQSDRTNFGCQFVCDQIYQEDWSKGIPEGVTLERAQNSDLAVVKIHDLRFPRALVASIEKDENFSDVANGKPRAEVIVPKPIRFELGYEYFIEWFTLIPQDFGFYSSQIITQIHQGSAYGSPPIMLALTQEGYIFRQRGSIDDEGQATPICCARTDKGKWVHWGLRYIPDTTGERAVSELWKDGRLVAKLTGQPNAYRDGLPSYLKVGIYMPGGWKPVERGPIRLFFGPITISTSHERQKEFESNETN